MKQVAIIGKGSSITDHLDFISSLQMDKMAINDMIFRIAAKYCVFWDAPNWIKLQDVNKIDSFGITIHEHFTDETAKKFNGFKTFINKGSKIDYHYKTVPSWNLSGLFAISVAALMNYDLIYLLGFDGGVLNGNRYSYTTIMDGSANYTMFNKYFKELNFQKHQKIVNVGLDSKINTFEKISIDEFRKITRTN